MTAKKDLKKLVRDRQMRTGESYTTALQHVLRQRPEEAPPEAEPAERSPVPVVEIADLSEDAARLGLRCRVTIDAALAARIDALTSSGLVSAAANRRALRIGAEPLDLFRAYMATYAAEQARCHLSPALVRNLEEHWRAHERQL